MTNQSYKAMMKGLNGAPSLEEQPNELVLNNDEELDNHPDKKELDYEELLTLSIANIAAKKLTPR